MNSLVFKPGVDATNVHPAIWIAIGVAFARHCVLSPLDMVVTAMQGTDHMHGSYHDAANTPSKMCQAVDIRTLDVPVEVRNSFAKAVTDDLEPLGYDVIHHHGQDAATPHLHIEYQPKIKEPDIFTNVGGKDNVGNPNRTKT